ncbi:MAG: OmpH family outer membrane protein [Melioribacteraceae bacterium]|nr:OmpH family outer membrane protein [Melioribacteraceae bacterium]
MKNYKIIITLLVLLTTQISFAQLKIGYVDSDAIMKELPDAQDAQKKLDQIVQEWQEELSKIEKEWKNAFDDYEKRKLIMSNQKRAEVEKELIALEKVITDFRQKKFGVNGELFKQQDEVMKPIQNKIFLAIEEVAKEEDYDFIFDRSGDILFLFAKEEYDVTPFVLEKLK